MRGRQCARLTAARRWPERSAGRRDDIDDDERPRDAASGADRITALRARVYGRDPDRAAVEELRALLQVGLPERTDASTEGASPASEQQRLPTWRRRVRILGLAATIVVAAAGPVSGGCPAGWSCQFVDGLVRGVLIDPDVAGEGGWRIGTAYVMDRRSGRVRCVVAPAAGRPWDVLARADMDAVRTLCLDGPASSSDIGSIATGLSASPG